MPVSSPVNGRLWGCGQKADTKVLWHIKYIIAYEAVLTFLDAWELIWPKTSMYIVFCFFSWFSVSPKQKKKSMGQKKRYYFPCSPLWKALMCGALVLSVRTQMLLYRAKLRRLAHCKGQPLPSALLAWRWTTFSSLLVQESSKAPHYLLPESHTYQMSVFSSEGCPSSVRAIIRGQGSPSDILCSNFFFFLEITKE